MIYCVTNFTDYEIDDLISLLLLILDWIICFYLLNHNQRIVIEAHRACNSFTQLTDQ